MDYMLDNLSPRFLRTAGKLPAGGFVRIPRSELRDTLRGQPTFKGVRGFHFTKRITKLWRFSQSSSSGKHRTRKTLAKFWYMKERGVQQDQEQGTREGDQSVGGACMTNVFTSSCH